MIYDIVENINNAIMNYYTIFFSDYLVNLKSLIYKPNYII